MFRSWLTKLSPLCPATYGSWLQTLTVLFTLASEKLEDDDKYDKSRITVRLVSAKTKGDTFGTSNLSLVD